jgi:hypothetical protein
MPRHEIQVLFAPEKWGSSNRFEPRLGYGPAAAGSPFSLRLD